MPEAFRNVSHTAYCLTLGPVRLGDPYLGELGKGLPRVGAHAGVGSAEDT
ncbi:aldehyde dehydrogenase [Bifidobacterium longum subsp. infantis]|nr:aldehyde dehydrogenase [Bifidobacterium longum subsp. infantis]MED7620511.1 aldehyde dehydrogenase [Bifidobacterium longum subsp. infantis]